jgi:hypothetical protein
MFATLRGKIAADGPARSSARGAGSIIAYDGPSRRLPRGGETQFTIDLFRGGPVGVFDFRVGHAS